MTDTNSSSEQKTVRDLKRPSIWTVARDIIGFMAVVASLVFVGIEVSNNTAATRGQTRQELAVLNQEWLTLLANDAEFAELWDRAWVRSGEVAPEEEPRIEYMMVLQLRRLENVFFQYQEGLVDESALRSYGLQGFNANLLQQPRFRNWWLVKNWRGSFHPDFVRFLEARTSGGS